MDLSLQSKMEFMGIGATLVFRVLLETVQKLEKRGRKGLQQGIRTVATSCCKEVKPLLPPSCFHRATLDHRLIPPRHTAAVMARTQAGAGHLETAPAPLSAKAERHLHLLLLSSAGEHHLVADSIHRHHSTPLHLILATASPSPGGPKLFA